MQAYQIHFRRHDKHTKFSYRYLTHPRERVLFSYSRNYSMICYMVYGITHYLRRQSGHSLHLSDKTYAPKWKIFLHGTTYRGRGPRRKYPL